LQIPERLEFNLDRLAADLWPVRVAKGLQIILQVRILHCLGRTADEENGLMPAVQNDFLNMLLLQDGIADNADEHIRPDQRFFPQCIDRFNLDDFPTGTFLGNNIHAAEMTVPDTMKKLLFQEAPDSAR